jgi:L-lysine 2,3-aminomutase
MTLIQGPTWRAILRQNYTRLEDLAEFLELDPEQLRQIDAHPRFSLNVPRRLAEKMAKRKSPYLSNFGMCYALPLLLS